MCPTSHPCSKGPSTHLSEIERGLTAPPRPPVLEGLAQILEVSIKTLKLTAGGWVVLDIAETLAPSPV